MVLACAGKSICAGSGKSLACAFIAVFDRPFDWTKAAVFPSHRAAFVQMRAPAWIADGDPGCGDRSSVG
jgi:hypothetical protein